MAEKILKAKKREITTKGAVKQLRREGYVPGIFYSKGNEGIPFAVEEVELNKVVFTSERNIIQLTFEDEKDTLGCVVKDVQFDPVSDKIVHVDMQGVTLGELLQLEVPISFVGSPVGVKEGGILQEQLHKIEIECMPRHIPQSLEVEISELGIGDSIFVKDLEFENIKFITPEDAVIVSVTAPKAEVEETTEDVTEEGTAEPEVISKGKSEEE